MVGPAPRGLGLCAVVRRRSPMRRSPEWLEGPFTRPPQDVAAADRSDSGVMGWLVVLGRLSTMKADKENAAPPPRTVPL